MTDRPSTPTQVGRRPSDAARRAGRHITEGPKPELEGWCSQKSTVAGGGDDSGITFDIDVYDAVSVAAFGGVSQRLDTASDFDKSTQLVHPFVLWLLSVLLFYIQMSILVMLEVTEDIDQPVHNPPEQLEKIMATGSWDISLLLTSKLIMIVVIQLMVFGEMFSAIKLFFVMVNPTTWWDIKGITIGKDESKFIKFIFRTSALCPWPAMACLAKFHIVYLVCVDSVSIVLCSEDVKDAIFNALALTFVADLDEMFWKFVSAIVHFEDFEDFKFVFAKNEDRRDAFLPASRGKYLTPFRRGHGLRKIENVLIVMTMFYIYQRQLFIVLNALHTNVLPVARDLCTVWRFAHSKSSHHFGLGAMAGLIKTKFTLVSPMTRINEVGAELCDDRAADFARMKTSDCILLWREYPTATWLGLVVIGIVLIVPQIVYSASIPIKNWMENKPANQQETQEEDAGDYMQQIAQLRKSIDELETQVGDRTKSAASDGTEKTPLMRRE